ncbi:MAG: methyltransferase domain-containing protein [Planctomycetes bacterium]|nr:methyltransferase domain-containing protein [Planctomycetota bacterium]
MQQGIDSARRDPLLKRFELRRLRLPVGGQMLNLVIPDSASWRRRGLWVDTVRRGGEPPYWSRIWPASVAVARLLLFGPALDGQAVCDLGCGLGVPAAAAMRRGANVTLVDQDADALAFAAFNARRQGDGRVAALRLDWSRETVSDAFAVMLLADVTYREVHHAPILRQLEAGLVAGGVVLHADPYRSESSTFLRRLGQAFAVATTEQTVAVEDGGDRLTIRSCVAARDAARLDAWIASSSPRWQWRRGGVP